MLTESEKRWLKDRRNKAFCRYCNVSKLCANPFASGYSCPLTGNMKDAAEFEARVAAKLARYAAMQSQQYGCEDCICTKAGVCYNGIKKECADIFLQTARFAVEEEMDAD